MRRAASLAVRGQCLGRVAVVAAAHRFGGTVISRVPARLGSSVASTNPATGTLIREWPVLPTEQALQAVDDVHATWESSWKRSTFQERAAVLKNASAILKRDTDKFAKVAVEEMGKCIKEARGEVLKCATICDYYAENAERLLAPEPVDTGLAPPAKSFVTFNPLGVILILMPWNFPFWQVFRQAATALSAGNAVVLKHAPTVMGCATMVEECLLEAGLPRNVFRNLVIEGEQVAPVLSHRHVKAVALTGSTPVGKIVGSLAGSLLKPAVLELGGSDPYLILEDADIAKAAKLCAAGRTMNCGQSCVGAKRFIVVDAVHDKFVEQFVKEMAAFKVGDPREETTDIGPMSTVAHRDKLHQQVQESVSKGAKLLLGGQLDASAPGAFYPPTVLANVTSGMPAYDEEMFGPVASVIRVKDEAEGIRVCNSSSFGLGSAVFTEDLARGERIATEELDAGLSFVNDFVKSDPRLPFGGIKESGFGRECGSYGLKEFVNIKTVIVK